LIRDELRAHETNFNELATQIQKHLSLEAQKKLIASVTSKKRQLTAQCREKGFGPLADQTLKEIETELGRTITRLRVGKTTQTDWERCAEQYEQIIEGELKARLALDQYEKKNETVEFAAQAAQVVKSHVEESLEQTDPFTALPSYVEEYVQTYRDSCAKAKIFIDVKTNTKKGDKGPDAGAFHCLSDYASPNTELGTFGHTFKSIWSTRTNGGTLVVLFVCVFVDFLMPLALYFLVARNESSRVLREEFYREPEVGS